MSSSSRSTVSTTSSPSMASATTPVYKGKFVNRSWGQLPPEIIRMICTNTLLLAHQQMFLPSSWLSKEVWPGRMLYIALRDQVYVEKLMKVCPSWQAALEQHTFWQHAIYAFDPADILINTSTIVQTGSSNTVRVSPYRHFRHIVTHSCTVCRLNTPLSYLGLNNAKRFVLLPYHGHVSVCKEHHKRDFCGVCLRSPCPPHLSYVQHQAESEMIACAENEDLETWPNIFTTCKYCRSEALWKRMSNSPADREAVGQGPPQWAADDWETRQVIDTFIDLGEGTVDEVIRVAQEKNWLRRYTRFADIMEQAVASQKYELKLTGGGAGGGYVNEGEDDSFELEDDSFELHQRAEDSGAKAPACEAWVRERILDGHWISPADDYYNQRPAAELLPAAEHPAAWLLDEHAVTTRHPTPKTIAVPAAPTYHLAEALYRIHKVKTREILLPPMSNIVKRIMLDSRNGEEAIRRASKLNLEELFQVLRETWPWVKEQLADEHVRKAAVLKHADDSSSSSTKSDGSHTTSPVLSTTTLQTTPSPPPKDAGPASDDTLDVIGPRPDEMASMCMEASSLMRYIPFVPLTAECLPPYSHEAIKSVWREACAPLYHCACSICKRTLMQSKAAEAAQNPQAYTYPPQSNPYPQTNVNPYPQNQQSYPQPIVATHDPNVESPVIAHPSPVISIPPQRQEYIPSTYSDLEDESEDEDDDDDLDGEGELDGVHNYYDWPQDEEGWETDHEATETIQASGGVDVGVEKEDGVKVDGYTLTEEGKVSRHRGQEVDGAVDKGKGKGKGKGKVVVESNAQPLWGFGPAPTLTEPKVPIPNIRKSGHQPPGSVASVPISHSNSRSKISLASPEPQRTPSRKRTSEELEEDGSPTGSFVTSSESEQEPSGVSPATPPKRARREGAYSDVRVDDLNPRLKKRSSGDVDVDPDGESPTPTRRMTGKRARVSVSPEEEVGQRANAEERRIAGSRGANMFKMLSRMKGKVDETG